MIGPFRWLRRHPLLRGLASTLLLGVACENADPTAEPAQAGGVFGGSSGVGTSGAPDAKPLAGQTSTGGSSGSSGMGALADVCANTPAGTVARIDDFNDGNSIATSEPNREAYWFTIHDDSPGILVPLSEFKPVAGGLDGSLAAHITASGYSIWGAAFAANISHKEATRCPYNASAFAGVRFVAKGHGAVRVLLSMPEVVDKDFGGACDPTRGQVCYDTHGSFIAPSDEYRVFELPWADFKQRGFGTQIPFDPKTILNLQFSFEVAELPIDFWVDDVSFWDGVPQAASAGGAGGQSGADAGGAGDAGAGGASGL